MGKVSLLDKTILKRPWILPLHFFKGIKQKRNPPAYIAFSFFFVARRAMRVSHEIPALRFKKALKEKKSLFREFMVPPPYQLTKDIFCLRAERVVNPYRKISFNNLELKVSGAPIREKLQLRIIPDKQSGLAEIRFWYKGQLVGIQKVKSEDLNLVHF